jgi:hypothetical protein
LLCGSISFCPVIVHNEEGSLVDFGAEEKAAALLIAV